MDRTEIRKIMEAELDDYEELCRLAEVYIEENRKDLKDRFYYAECLEKPVKEEQIFFWNGSQCSFEGIPRNVFENFVKQFGEKCTCVWAKKEVSAEWEKLPKNVRCVKKNSPEYWEALAVSGCLIGDGNLPVPFVKRKEQLYFNVYHRPEEAGIDALSLYRKELDKADYLFLKPGDGMTAEEEKSENKKNKGSGKHRRKILFLTNGREERENRQMVKAMLRAADREKYQITVITPRLMSGSLEAEFENLSEEADKFIYRGRMTLNREDFLLLRVLEKHPGLYMENREIRAFVDELMEREWNRIWGADRRFDCVVLAGQLTVQQFYMAAALHCDKKILADMNFLPYVKERSRDEWEKLLTFFDRVYGPEDSEIRELQDRIREAALREGRASDHPLEFRGETFRVADTWKGEHHRTVRKLERI